MTQTFHGAWPALITPATAEGEVNYGVLRELTEYLIGKQIGGLYVCGSTGEGLQLSVEERVRVTDEVMAQVRGRIPIVVHVGAAATRDAVALARHAQRAGAAGFGSVLPTIGAG
ncbi:MAG: dihydrodipicolinate synthase family protein, partial [Anaerolineae bacterium]|nr:dihydrodipicolinate synthase family protein [Anaerolineae bacterium]